MPGSKGETCVPTPPLDPPMTVLRFYACVKIHSDIQSTACVRARGGVCVLFLAKFCEIIQ